MEDSITKEQLDGLLCDYFQVMGMKKVHDAFIREAEIPGEVEGSYLAERAEINKHVLAGEIRQAVSKVSDIDSNLLRNIGFHLQKQALLEIIRKGDSMVEAMKYAQVQVAPLAKDRPEFVAELENIMTLLLYQNASQSPDSRYLSDEQRLKTASITNTALLHYAKRSEVTQLERISKAIFWAQNIAQAHGIATPKLLDLRNLIFESEVEQMAGVGSELPEKMSVDSGEAHEGEEDLDEGDDDDDDEDDGDDDDRGDDDDDDDGGNDDGDDDAASGGDEDILFNAAHTILRQVHPRYGPHT